MNSPSAQAILLVDGYNIVGAWPELIQLRDSSGLESARNQLAEVLANYSAFKDFETWLIFDAYGHRRAHHSESVTQHLSIHYTRFGQTADSYIEKACAQFRNDVRKFQQRLIVATSDRAQQLTVIGYGAEWMSAQQLESDVTFSLQRVRRRQKSKQRSRRSSLANSLGPEAKAKLSRLRFGLPD
ncbi:MAG: NYN domain-containing protein [Leptolyngbya sp. SIO4C1]|nr:NYN domain-containing protein [Leptolyngbya sp. SIO4C1]